jgi:hypothetical protein
MFPPYTRDVADERRPGIRVLYLICRSCNLDWMTIEDITNAARVSDAWPLLS